MKKSVVFLLVVISLFACVSTVFAKDASELIGTITSYVEEIQKYPEALRDACGTDMFKQKLTELANLITGANDAMAEAGLPNTLNLWAVYSAVTSNVSDCSFFTSALSKADWSREELDRIGYKYGLYDTPVSLPKRCGYYYWEGMTLREALTPMGFDANICDDQDQETEYGNACDIVVLLNCDDEEDLEELSNWGIPSIGNYDLTELIR